MNREDLHNHMKATFAEALLIAAAKNNDYAKGDDPFKNFKVSEVVGVPVERGIMVRMMDKVARISNSFDTELKVKDESVSDTLNDLINYAAILKAYLSQK